METKENKYWESEFELRDFIDMATRWTIGTFARYSTDDHPYTFFTSHVEKARNNFDLFCAQLRDVLSKSINREDIGTDLKSRFLPAIDHYIKWYEANSVEISQLKYNPYELMLSYIVSTKMEILKYFPMGDHGTRARAGKGRKVNEYPNKFEELFYKKEDIEPSVSILREIPCPAIDENNTYIGKAKGVYQYWINVLKAKHIIKPYPDRIYATLCNEYFEGLKLDESELRKYYTRLENSGIELSIKTIFSQKALCGKSGK